MTEDCQYQYLPFQFNTALIPHSQPCLSENWVIQVVHTDVAVLRIVLIENCTVADCLKHSYHGESVLAKQIRSAWQDYTQAALPQAFEQLPVDYGQYAVGKDVKLSQHPTAFQQAVWHQVRGIAFGQTKTYGQLAQAMGKPNIASRSVGGAVGKNPVPLLVPCHRVVPASGGMTNFCASPNLMVIKQFLLAWEAQNYR